MSWKQTILVCSLLLTILLAGCVAPFAGDGASPPDPETNRTVSEEKPYELPLNAVEIDRRHGESLSEYGSFRYRRTARTSEESDGTTDERNRWSRAEVNLTSGALNATIWSDDGNVTRLYRNETGHLRARSSRPLPRLTSQRESKPSYYADLQFRAYTWGVTYNYTGTTTKDGRTLYVYRVPSKASMDIDYNESELSEGDVKELNLSLFFTEEGALYRVKSVFAVEMNGTVFRTVEIIEYTDLGNATVTRPEWASNESTESSVTRRSSTSVRSGPSSGTPVVARD